MASQSKLRPAILGSFSPQVLASIRSWGRQGMKPGLVNVTADLREVVGSKYLAQSINFSRKLLYTDAGLEVIKSFLVQFKASGLLCIDEEISCWINDNIDKLPPWVTVWLPPNATIRQLLSKKRQLEIAAEVGLQALPTYLIHDICSSLPKIDAYHFPICLRPSEPWSVVPAFKVLLLNSMEELEQFIRGLHEIHKPIIAQPFKPFPNLIVQGVRSLNGESLGVQGFLVERKFEGVSLTMRPVAITEVLQRKCVAFTDALNLIGSYDFEFLYDPQSHETFYIEISNRLGGTTAKVFACGYDGPILALQGYGVPVRLENKELKDVTSTSKRALLKYVHYCLRGWLTPLDYPAESRWRQVISALKGLFFYRDDVFAFDDLAGTWSMYAGTLRCLGKRKRKEGGDRKNRV